MVSQGYCRELLYLSQRQALKVIAIIPHSPGSVCQAWYCTASIFQTWSVTLMLQSGSEWKKWLLSVLFTPPLCPSASLDSCSTPSCYLCGLSEPILCIVAQCINQGSIRTLTKALLPVVCVGGGGVAYSLPLCNAVQLIIAYSFYISSFQFVGSCPDWRLCLQKELSYCSAETLLTSSSGWSHFEWQQI